VREGQHVKAGDVIGKAGLANAWHTHFMVNGRTDAKGLGDRDPRPFVDYARAH
jgi:murein DD-endopeptidase MepM/ murein hydrolase activator NlpD